MTSRSKDDLHPELVKRFEYLKENWDWSGTPILTATYRSINRQRELYNTPGVVAAPPGKSLHNYKPALAFDVAFVNDKGIADWDFKRFEEWGRRAKKLGLQWGGDWKAVDGPHVQLPMTYRQARAGEPIPDLPPVPNDKTVNDYLVDIRNHLQNIVGIMRS